MVLPDAQALTKIEDALTGVVDAIEANDLWVPPKPHQTLYFIWDFVKRSKYMLSEVDNIKNGKALKYPDQFRPVPGSGQAAAVVVFKDVCSRVLMMEMLVKDPTKTAMMTGQSSAVDFDPVAKEKVETLVKTLPTNV